MRIDDYKQGNLEKVVEAGEKAKASQERLNAVVSFCDIEEQIKDYKHTQSDLLFQTPVALKDNINTKGTRTTASSRILDNYIPVYNATIVDKLKAAGAVFVAKTSMDELGMGGTNLNAYTGKVNNPWDLQRISGGSSGGSAALVAEGVVPLAIGSDTGDSVRKPAAYCGVVGLKPTYGRISRYGIIPYASSLDHVGLFTTTIKDAATALEVLAGRDDNDMTTSYKPVEKYSSLLNSDLQGKRIGVIKNVMDAIEDKTIQETFKQLLDKLESRGAIIEDVVFDTDLMNALLPTYYVISNAEATANHSNLDGIRFGVREDGDDLTSIMINSRTKGFSSEVRKRFVIGSYSLFTENQDKIFRKAQKVRRRIVDALKEKLASYDVLLASAAGSIAPYPDESYGEKLSATYLVAENHMLLGNFSGYPSITVPNAIVDGMPVAVNLLAKPFEETLMLSIAKAIEEECGLEGYCREVSE
ncbi:aspartyl-tRNA(Asn)/glutamyl-tRNA(Gln) amidotransferase subunit A [Breznakia sp. PF5-3]|uniref:amidase family protein n=1 Tax=unclassified Breznakia TaxID=2623764 RepID=UPI002406CE05|nr:MULTISPECIES: amidase family protein [unclassified Breznakia]MDF9823759.1 aspartyl-tRNA(Asn)/glutamyl-tRNA(Gln) amidotransferase subunit A [Breznakia sp. PM6-1]MDF9834557.1 aspartyl-tRNA(Asn)/glutamyl-tRNA(Gln) amidotransferase subunit A [Breznakia sp. PF5-3]MDF9838250.1 aspartyl-tRNA(Asn)/glutamyl-tRNA(Gln) amidotransferase subunit A [Breznakia sp. PFB2-8]MDF9860266.1 aspartyl-tRNA(Asn)/glutamyl-tRNA(Gln) amidotransferase subunit A [Breznakia sp. PH5-24]